MLSKGIDTTIRELIQQLPKSANGSIAVGGEFEKLIAPLAAEIAKALTAASAQTGSPSSSTGTGASVDPTRSPSARLSPFQVSLLKDQESAVLERLPNELTAGDLQYNQREALLRNRVDLDGLERRLRDSADNLDVTYDRSDLDGIIRNAGYDAVHMGASDRYMAAIEKYLGEAEKRYKERADNSPGQLA